MWNKVEMGSCTGACILGIAHQGEVDEIVSVIEWVVEVGVITAAPRVGDESEKKDDEREANGCDCPLLLGPLPPPSQTSKPWVRHCSWLRVLRYLTYSWTGSLFYLSLLWCNFLSFIFGSWLLAYLFQFLFLYLKKPQEIY